MKSRIIFSLLFVFLLSASAEAQYEDSYKEYQKASRVVRNQKISRALDRFESAIDIQPYPVANASTKGDSSDISYALIDEQQALLALADEKRLVFDQEKPDPVRDNLVQKELDRIECVFNMTSGFRIDEFRWSIAGNISGSSPNVLSELVWEELLSYQIGGHANVLWRDHYRAEGSLGYGWIIDGKNTDSDYAGDNRTVEFSKSHAVTKDDHTFDSSFGIGYQMALDPKEEWREFLGDDLNIVFLGGYSYHEIRVKDRELFQDVPPLGSSINSDVCGVYKGTWKGPWLGMELTGSREKFRGFSRWEYHYVDYFGDADWVLRTDFQHPTSFVHESDGFGYIVSCGGEYDVTDEWSLGLNFKYQNWEMEHGIDRTFFTNGAVAETKLNEVKWRSYALMLSATYHFSMGKDPEETDVENNFADTMSADYSLLEESRKNNILPNG